MFSARSSSARALLIIVALLALAGLFLVLRPVVAGPQQRVYEVTISDAGMTPQELNATEGDRVRIRVTSDRAVSFHLHGYDLVAKGGPGDVGPLEFTAVKTGRFEIEDEEREEALGELIVEPR